MSELRSFFPAVQAKLLTTVPMGSKAGPDEPAIGGPGGPGFGHAGACQSWIQTHQTAMSLLYALRPDFGQHQFQKDTVMSTILSRRLLDSVAIFQKHHRH